MEGIENAPFDLCERQKVVLTAAMNSWMPIR